ncbi:MAG TPA: immunoglobulin domain-containing protein, partial [Bacteroidia bacterium]|nr:immunoglobulin domain-containing protein [Bacteroidia bacterium]
MKSKVLLSITIILLLFLPKVNYGQAPAIGTQPSDQIVCEGASATFSVAATGTALTYQWRKGIINLVDGGNILGSATATLTINPVSVSDASSDYNVIVSGSIGPNDTSDYAALDVNTAPDITLQPTNQIICAGDTVRFLVEANGLNLTYQWRNGTTDLVSAGNILDATAATLVIYPATISDTSSYYNVVVTGGCPPSSTSINAS